jgi:membrane protease YdiL (CAAX protease family)
MLSELTEAMIVNGAVLAGVLVSDLGPARRIGPARILRPVIAVAVIVPLFISQPVTHGTGLVVELAGAVAGLLCGLAAAGLMRVYRSPETGRPVSRAGWPYALLWTAVVGARAAFSWGAAHWFQAQIVSWAIANQVTEAAITDGLIFMALAMVLVRTIGLRLRASRLPAAPVLAPQNA